MDLMTTGKESFFKKKQQRSVLVIVDIKSGFADNLAKELRSINYDVEDFTTSGSGLPRIPAQVFSIVIFIFSGTAAPEQCEAIAHVHTMDMDCPIIAITCADIKTAKAGLLEAGSDAVFALPAGMTKQLFQAIRFFAQISRHGAAKEPGRPKRVEQ